ncbi:MAG: hypothetical protein CMN30_14965 [Sandaracinus sp.]|nr:hypothetical protein [Sandaracinus sp.]
MARLLVIALLLGSACGDDLPARPAVDAGPTVPDGSMGTPNDWDGDGLCNATETANGTDPLAFDTDLDGFPDRLELDLGYDPLTFGSPATDDYHILRETEASSVQAAYELTVSASGEEYGGGFDPIPMFDLADQDAGTFYRGSVATFADPPDNVAELDPTTETFRGVVGRTRLGFEVFFEYGGAITRGCNRAYPFQYTVKRQDGVRLARFTELLVVLPVGQQLESTDWCIPDECR